MTGPGELSITDQGSSSPSIARQLDMSAFSGTAGPVTLSFAYSTSGSPGAGDSVILEISTDAGSSYTTVATYTGTTSGTENQDIVAFLSDETRLRFRVSAGYGGVGEAFLVDDVDIAVTDGRLLDWSSVLSPASLDANEELTIAYDVVIPSGSSRVLTNTATATVVLNGSTFSPTETADVVATDISIAKTVSVTTAEPGDTITYDFDVANGGASEKGVVITDPVPSDTTFAGSIVDDGPFTGAFDAGQNAVVWTAGTFVGGTGPFTLGFDVTINGLAPANTVVENTVEYESDETAPFDSNAVETTVVGPELAVVKTVLNDPDPVHPQETVTYVIIIDNSGAGTANNVLIEDLFRANGTYVADSMEFRKNVDPLASLTDAADTDLGTAFVDRVEFGAGLDLGPGENLEFRFQVTVDGGTSGLNLDNQATVNSDEVASLDSNLDSRLIDGDAEVTGHLFIDLDDDGIQSGGEQDLANVDVLVTDEDGNTQTVTTDANGDYSVIVPADGTGSTTVNVDETDADFPSGAVICSQASPLCQDPQTVTAVSAGSVATDPVGYVPPPLAVTKTSDVISPGVAPGDTITYTIVIDNDSGFNRSGIDVNDPLPTGTSAVAGSTVGTSPAIRAIEYFVEGGTFTGPTHDLTLAQDLASDYFVIIQGSDNNGGASTPESDFVSLTHDPGGTGDLDDIGGGLTDVIRLTRNGNDNDWIGVGTVVESLTGAGADGFVLHDVLRIDHGTDETGSEAFTGTVTDTSKVVPLGGFNGAGCDSTDTDKKNHISCHVRLVPANLSGVGGDIDWSRSADVKAQKQAVSTVMVVEWGAEWDVQHVQVTGNNADKELDVTTGYDTTAIASVVRDNTWVWGTGFTDSHKTGKSAEGAVITIGDGINQNATETTVAVGLAKAANKDFEVYTFTYDNLAVDYRLKAYGDKNESEVDVTVDTAALASQRMALSYNNTEKDDDKWPIPMASARYTDDTTVTILRNRTGKKLGIINPN